MMGLGIMIFGVILVVIGIILYEISIRNRKGQTGWTYALLIVGAVATVVGAILLGMGLVRSMSSPVTRTYPKMPVGETPYVPFQQYQSTVPGMSYTYY
jgi:predicted permease